MNALFTLIVIVNALTSMTSSYYTTSTNPNNDRNSYFSAAVVDGELAVVSDHGDEVSCNSVAQYPELNMADYEANGNPNWYTEDYLGDFGWWMEQNGLCAGSYTPEANPNN